MSRKSRAKGNTGERELCRLLRDELGEDVARNLDQVRDGGADLLGVGPFAVEVKRAERLELATWWVQACQQAQMTTMVPALAYRQNRRPWAFVVPLPWLMDRCRWDDWTECDATAVLDLRGFCEVARERMEAA